MYLSKKLILWLFNRKKKIIQSDWNNIQSILIRPIGDAIGDAIAHIAYVRQIKAIYPNCRIGVLVTKRNRDVFSCCNQVDELIPNKRIHYLKHRKKWELLLDFYENFTSKYIINDWLLAPNISIIFKKNNKQYYSLHNVKNYDYYCPLPENCHIANRLMHSEIAKHIQLPLAQFHLDLPASGYKHGNSLWSNDPSHKNIRILLAPQGSYVRRYIPPKELATLLNNIPQHHLPHISFMLCRAKYSENYFSRLKKFCHNEILVQLSPPTSVYEYLGLVASSDIAVCIDSGSVHLACAFNRPLLAFYANLPENLNMWRPHSNPDIPCHTLIANTEVSKRTKNFPIEEGSKWLNHQIDTLINQIQKSI